MSAADGSSIHLHREAFVKKLFLGGLTLVALAAAATCAPPTCS
jgi:hypothetical protein